jgi:hypothetical protein
MSMALLYFWKNSTTQWRTQDKTHDASKGQYQCLWMRHRSYITLPWPQHPKYDKAQIERRKEEKKKKKKKP